MKFYLHLFEFIILSVFTIVFIIFQIRLDKKKKALEKKKEELRRKLDKI